MREWDAPGYTEVRELGSGGFGDVVLARHDASGTLVAIKYLHRTLLDDPEFAGMFRAEARVLASLDDPNVVRLYEYVESPSGAAIVMEPIDGVSLREILSDQGKTTAEAALVVLQGSLLGLAAAHARGVVHRDYKPENVLVDGAGVSKLTDFGIAARAGDRTVPAGTLAYAPPEQFDGGPASPATDVYAATATFYECLTGHPPFTGDTAEALRHQHRSEPVPLEPVPGPLRPLVAAGMAKDPGDRPVDAASFVTELRAAARPAYGQDWEERGRSHLGEAALLLAALWPSGAAPAVQGNTVEQVHLSRGAQETHDPQHLKHLQHPGHGDHPGQPGRSLPSHSGAGTTAAQGAESAGVTIGAAASAAQPATRLQRLVSGASRSRRLPRWLRRALPHDPSAGTAVAITAGATATAVAIVAAVAAIATALTSANSSSAAVGSVCSLVVDHTTSCESTNPKVQVYGYYIDNTSGCTYVRDIDWGDGTKSENVIVPGGPAGPKFEGSHTYSAPGSYTIYFGGHVQGNCTIATPTFHFKLLSR
jgi:serine/threonine protein kinase